jgi:hypothetical protein
VTWSPEPRRPSSVRYASPLLQIPIAGTPTAGKGRERLSSCSGIAFARYQFSPAVSAPGREGSAGRSAKVDGAGASEQAAADRLELLRAALDVIFGGGPTFQCCWTYISATRTRAEGRSL